MHSVAEKEQGEPRCPARSRPHKGQVGAQGLACGPPPLSAPRPGNRIAIGDTGPESGFCAI